MIIDDIKKICVVGAGNMGHQIATLCAAGSLRPGDRLPSVRELARELARALAQHRHGEEA